MKNEEIGKLKAYKKKYEWNNNNVDTITLTFFKDDTGKKYGEKDGLHFLNFENQERCFKRKPRHNQINIATDKWVS